MQHTRLADGVARVRSTVTVRCLLLVAALLTGMVALASQPHPRPRKGQDTDCTDCRNENAPVNGVSKKTVGFNDPLFAYVGRYVDSANTRNVQDIGMRTVRAQRVRVSRARDRIFVEYGEAVAAFPIQQFLTNVQDPNLWGVGVMRTGATADRYGDPIERVAKPRTFFYAEADGSGWETKSQDTQETLTDFDVDDAGNVYVGTLSWGWGISHDENPFDDTRHMEMRSQVLSDIEPTRVMAIRSGGTAYAVVSASGVVSGSKVSQLVYDVTDPAAPLVTRTRKGKPNAIQIWARDDARKRLAVVTADKKLHIYDYDTFVSVDEPEPVETFDPAAGAKFWDLTFDEDGTLWAIESGDSPATGNRLWQLTRDATASAYTATWHGVYASSVFAPRTIAVRKGYVAVGGHIPAAAPPENESELRLYRMTNGTLRFLDTEDFFFRYYHDKTPPEGYVTASTYNPAYTSLYALHLLDYGDKLYLLYSANGLGDVYEIKDTGLRATVTLAAPSTPAAFGSTMTLTATLAVDPSGTPPPAGTIAFTENGTAFAAVPLIPGEGSSYTASVTRPGLLPGTYTYAVSYAGDGVYRPAASTPHVHVVEHVKPVIQADGGSGVVHVTWTAVPGVHYDVVRQTAGLLLPLPLARVDGGQYVDTAVTPASFYRYTVNAVYPNGSSGPPSVPDVATTFAFTDEDLPEGTTVRAAHILELRTAVNGLRQLVGSPLQLFDAGPVSGAPIRAADLADLQIAALPACTLLGIVYTPGLPPAPGESLIRRADVLALRALVK